MIKLFQTLGVTLLASLLLATAASAECSSCGERKCTDCVQGCMCGSNKCESASRNYCRCKSKCRSCWGGCGSWSQGDACCPSAAEVVTVCASDCGCQSGHPYEQVYNGSSMLCDTGCQAYLPCKRVGVVCETKCQARGSSCGCNKCQVDYCVTQECHELERPRVVPWWFNAGRGNLYPEAGDPALAMVATQDGGMKIAGTAGSPEAVAGDSGGAAESSSENG